MKSNDKKNWMNSKFLNLGLSFLLAILLSAYVLSTQSGGRSGNNQFTSILPEKKVNLTVPLQVQYDDSQYVVVGAPANVNLSVHGAAALVTATQSHNDIQAVADLRDLGVGQHNVKLAVKGVNAALTSTVTPQSINVTIVKKTTEKRNIKVTYDNSKLASGYSVTDTSFSPKSVTISGPKSNVDSVAYVAAEVDLDPGTKSDVTKDAKLVALDRSGNPVQVEISAKSLQVSLKVSSSPSKKVQLTADTENGDASDYDISFNPGSVTLYGSSDQLANYDSLSVPVDLSQAKSKTTIEVDVTKPNGVDRISDNQVQVTISPK
ncbi:CdaR family protein [Eupransor demetentiae]|uniref:YbbR domain (YbbR) n=1 Tax=Eupransor demetentiae TaxID=3109584 RepID=A0ABP0EPI7_9LACO|nr:Cyclic di-AMP synthase regulator CdaR [Lactobacillaceae bacterium LMG 33000]